MSFGCPTSAWGKPCAAQAWKTWRLTLSKLEGLNLGEEHLGTASFGTHIGQQLARVFRHGSAVAQSAALERVQVIAKRRTAADGSLRAKE